MFILFRVHLNSVSGLCQIVIVVYSTGLISLTLRCLLFYLSDTLDLIDCFSERAPVLLSSRLCCFLEACGVGFVLFLIEFVWQYLAVCICQIKHDGPCDWCGRSCWRPFRIACIEVMEVMQSMPSVFAQ